MLTLRGDFVGKALAYRPLSDRLQAAQINLGPMTREELSPQSVNLRRKSNWNSKQVWSGAFSTMSGTNLAICRFWNLCLKNFGRSGVVGVLLNETYDAIGGLQGAVATKADELFKAFLPQSGNPPARFPADRAPS